MAVKHAVFLTVEQAEWIRDIFEMVRDKDSGIVEERALDVEWDEFVALCADIQDEMTSMVSRHREW